MDALASRLVISINSRVSFSSKKDLNSLSLNHKRLEVGPKNNIVLGFTSITKSTSQFVGRFLALYFKKTSVKSKCFPDINNFSGMFRVKGKILMQQTFRLPSINLIMFIISILVVCIGFETEEFLFFHKSLSQAIT